MSDTTRKPGKLNTSFFENKIAEQSNTNNASNERKPQPGKLSDRAALFNNVVNTNISRQNSNITDTDSITTDNNDNKPKSVGKLIDRTSMFSNSRSNSNADVVDDNTNNDTTTTTQQQPRKVGKLNIDLSGLNATLAQGPKFGTAPRQQLVTATNNDTTSDTRTFVSNVNMSDIDQPNSSPAPGSASSTQPQHNRTMSSISATTNYTTDGETTPLPDSTATTESTQPKPTTRAILNRNKQRKLPSNVTQFVAPVITTPTTVPLPAVNEQTEQVSCDNNDASSDTATNTINEAIHTPSSTLDNKRPDHIDTITPHSIQTATVQAKQHLRNDTFDSIDNVLNTVNISNNVTPSHTTSNSMTNDIQVVSPVPAPPPIPENASELDTPTPRAIPSPTDDNTTPPSDTTVHNDKHAQKLRLEQMLRAGPSMKHIRTTSTSSNYNNNESMTAPVVQEQYTPTQHSTHHDAQLYCQMTE